MEVDAYFKNQRNDGRWEILSRLTSPPHAVGAMSWISESDADFLLGHLNNAFNAGARMGAQIAQESDSDSTKVAPAVRSIALNAAASVAQGSADFTATIGLARQFEEYIKNG